MVMNAPMPTSLDSKDVNANTNTNTNANTNANTSVNTPTNLIQRLKIMQKRETTLSEQLDNPALSPDQRDRIVDAINVLAQARMQLFDLVQEVYSTAQASATQVDETIAQQLVALRIIETQMNATKRQQNAAKQSRSNQMRLVELNTYYGKRYYAYTQLMKTIVLVCIPLAGLYTLRARGIIGDKLTAVITGFVLFFGGFALIKMIIDYSMRDTMNFDQYQWSFDSSTAPAEGDGIDADAEGDTSGDIWSGVGIEGSVASTAAICVGAECCADTMTYDAKTNRCGVIITAT